MVADPGVRIGGDRVGGIDGGFSEAGPRERRGGVCGHNSGEVLDGLRTSGRELITIDPKQLLQFAGNVLQLQTKPSGSALAISTAACLALRSDQRQAIEKHARIVESPLPLFESIGGGSARCMMADVHLPRM